MSVINIPELFKAVAAKVAAKLTFPVFFDYGRYLEIDRRLTEKAGGKTTKAERFPLIWLVIPFSETNGGTGEYTELTNLQIIIAAITDPESTTPDRMNTNFKDVLYPIYEELLKQITISGYFSEIGYNIPHTKTDQPYWDGKENGTQQANMFSEFIDAIQLKNIRLTVNETTCSRFRLIAA